MKQETEETKELSIGRELYDLLPAVYRNRDRNRGLERYLSALGVLLDRVRQTLEQRLADSFPAALRNGRASQEWLLPYFARLLDARLVSPHVPGRRQEVSEAISWRQRKGTLRCAEEVVEAVAQTEVEIQEGFQRVAVTPRIGLPLLPAGVYGEAEPETTVPSQAARHPGLPAVTVDFRYLSRAVQGEAGHPAVRTRTFGEQKLSWRRTEPFGVPCFPGSYEDASRRTVDLRTPDWKRGHYHPSRLLLFAPPPTGFFPPGQVELKWSDREGPEHKPHIRIEKKEGVYRLKIPLNEAGTEPATKVVSVITKVELPAGFPHYYVEGLNFLSSLTIKSGQVTLRGVAAKKLVVKGIGEDPPVLDAVDCLFDEVEVKNGLARLEYCTVMKEIHYNKLQASDCLFAGSMKIVEGVKESDSCFRYSRIPPELWDGLEQTVRPATTSGHPTFFDFKFCGKDGKPKKESEFGDPSYGVLHPATPESICFGAEDGGEMGAYHARHYCLQRNAALDKLGDFLPLGIDPVWIPDARLLTPPPVPIPWVHKFDPGSATAGDGPVTLTVDGTGFRPIPWIEKLTPDSATTGDGPLNLTVEGMGFMNKPGAQKNKKSGKSKKSRKGKRQSP